MGSVLQLLRDVPVYQYTEPESSSSSSSEICDIEGYVKRPRPQHREMQDPESDTLLRAVMDNVADNSDDSLDSETIACNPWDSLALRRAGLTER